MHRTRTLARLFAIAAILPMSSCSISSTEPKDPPTLLGDWVLVDTGTMEVVSHDGTSLGNSFFTMKIRSTFKEDGSLVTRKRTTYDPPPPWWPDTEFVELGTWRMSGDTLVRDELPGALGSLDSSRFTLTASTLTLVPLHAVNSYREVFSRP